jgi:hypothetical protein
MPRGLLSAVVDRPVKGQIPGEAASGELEPPCGGTRSARRPERNALVGVVYTVQPRLDVRGSREPTRNTDRDAMVPGWQGCPGLLTSGGDRRALAIGVCLKNRLPIAPRPVLYSFEQDGAAARVRIKLMPDPVTLAVHCAHCSEAVTLELASWAPDDPPTEHTYGCPSCGRQNRIETPGRVLWARNGHGRGTLLGR